MNTNLMFSSKDQTWETPQDLFDVLNNEFNFTLDPCCTKETAKCVNYFTEKEDGLKQSWKNHKVFVNPPYGRAIKDWVKKSANSEADVVVMLIPARTDTTYFHEYIYMKKNVEIRFLKGRVKFKINGESKDAAPFPSMLVIFKKE